MSFLRTLDGAVKWRFRHFLREEDTVLLNFITDSQQRQKKEHVLVASVYVRYPDVY